MRKLLLMLLTSISLALTAPAVTQASTPPDRKVYATAPASPVATPQVTAEMPVAYALQPEVVATSTPASTTEAAVLPTPVTVASDVLAPPNPGKLAVIPPKRAWYQREEERPVTFASLHIDPGRQR